MDGPAHIRLQDSIPATGLTVVAEPLEPSIDVVFVHGFTGHPERTWAHKKGDAKISKDEVSLDERASKSRRLNTFLSLNQATSAHQEVYWPRDVLPETAPDARVLTFGYDTHIRHWLGPPVNRATVYDIAWDFLVALEAARRAAPERPICFIAHSLGGIVIKEMLRRSSLCQSGQGHLRTIFTSIKGIIFFGTPHGGSDPRGFLQHVAEKLIKAVGFSVNQQIIDTLLPTGERLSELKDAFGPMVRQQGWVIHSFQEQFGVKLLNGNKVSIFFTYSYPITHSFQVVEDTSSQLHLLDFEITEHIGRNHMDMCRFIGPADIEYKKFSAAFNRIRMGTSPQLPTEDTTTLNDRQLRQMLDSLKFDQMDVRHNTIKAAHTKTCKWILQKPEYRYWLDPTENYRSSPFIWIKGKAGTGKSTLMKFALGNARRKLKNTTIVSFFFNARGHELEKTTIGMYQSLLIQLLERMPKLQSMLASFRQSTWIADHHIWSLESLKSLFAQAIQSIGETAVVCFIDALDECDDAEIREMVSFFSHLGQLTIADGLSFRVCFSSRHYPHITVDQGQELVLEGQEGHHQDILNYIESELKIGHSKLADHVRQEVQEKSSGIFMWVVLVVEILNKEFDRGRIHALRRRLGEIPGDLHELFRDILTRDTRNRDELLLCIQWILFAQKPLRPEQLYFAILSGIDHDNQSSMTWDKEEITSADIQRYILDSSKGLVEVTKSKIQTVQFIHESIRDFLLKEDGLGVLWCNDRNELEGLTHNRLKQCCLNYILAVSLPQVSPDSRAELLNSLSSSCPFLEYAVPNVLQHADMAQYGGVDQKDFMEVFPFTRWAQFHDIFEKFVIRQYGSYIRPAYILAEMGLSHLIKINHFRQSYLDVGNERYGTPLFAAMATGHDGAAQSFLEVEVEEFPPGHPARHLYDEYCQLGSKAHIFQRTFKFIQGGIEMHLQQEGNEIILGFLLKIHKLKLNPDLLKELFLRASRTGKHEFVRMCLEENLVGSITDSTNRTALSYGSEQGHTQIVKVLLRYSQDESRIADDRGRTPLAYAAAGYNTEIIRILLQHAPETIDIPDNNGSTPLLHAVKSGIFSVSQLLIQFGANASHKDIMGQTPLSSAVYVGCYKICELLVQTGKIDIDSRDNNGWTPFSRAAGSGNQNISNFLIQTGKIDINSRDNNGRTPLSWAAGNGNQMVSLLIHNSKIDIDSRDNNGRTPFSWATGNGNQKISNLLIQTGKIDIDSRDNDGRTPLSFAAEGNSYNSSKMVLDLLDTGKVDANSSDGWRRTPLFYAALKGQYRNVRCLLIYGANINVSMDQRDDEGMTPYEVALKHGHNRVAMIFRIFQWNRQRNGHRNQVCL